MTENDLFERFINSLESVQSSIEGLQTDLGILCAVLEKLASPEISE